MSQKVTINIRAHHDGKLIPNEEFTVIDELMGHLPYKILGQMEIPSGITLADPEYMMPGEIDLLFGAGIWAKSMRPTMYRNSVGTILHETDFGYIILGQYEYDLSSANHFSICHADQGENPQESRDLSELTKALKAFWEIQELNGKRLRSPQEDMVEQTFRDTHCRHQDGRYQVDIPLIPNHEPLGDSRATAVKRFLWLEKRLQRSP